MKKIIILTLFLFNVPVLSQCGQIEYVSFLKSDVTSYFNKELDNIVDENDSKISYSLIVNGNKSIFFSENTLSEKTNRINWYYFFRPEKQSIRSEENSFW
jgi:hypothetical protein